MNADFAAMPEIVGEGRRVINNITRASSLFLVKTLYSFMLSVLMLVLPLTYPFQPIQLTLVSSLTVGIPSFFLALEPNQERVRGNFLQTVLSRALPGAIAVTVCSSLAMVCGEAFGLPTDMDSTLATLVTAMVGLMVLFRVCLPLNRNRIVLFSAMLLGMAGAVLFANKVFYLAHLQGQPIAILLFLVLSILAFFLMFLITRTEKHLEKRRAERATLGERPLL